jgi:predicted RNA-binding protein
MPHQSHQGAKHMCDINVFIVKDGIEEKVLENVDLVEAVAGGIRLVNIFGEERKISGEMVRFDNSQKRMIFQS